MTWIPSVVDAVLREALVAELTVVGPSGQPITHPLIPLWDGEHVYMTSSILFSKKVEHIKRNPKVSVAVTDPAATAGIPTRCTIQGDARILEDDPHDSWLEVLPLWRAKEPAIDAFVGKRFALPLFFERLLIEITPRTILYWADGNVAKPPERVVAPERSR